MSLQRVRPVKCSFMRVGESQFWDRLRLDVYGIPVDRQGASQS